MGWFRRARSAVFGSGRRAASDPALDDRYYTDYSPLPNAAGIGRLTPDLAIKQSAVARSVTILSDVLSTTPIRVYRLKVPGLVEGGMDPAPDHPIDALITMQPNRWQTAAEFWGMMGFHAALRGVAYAEIKPGPRGFVDQLLPIHPDRVTVEMLPDMTLRFTVRDPKTGSTRILLQEEMFRIPGLSSDGISGIRTVDLASEQIGLAMAADQYAARIFSNALNMGGFFSHPGKLSVAAVDRLRTMLMERFSGVRNAHKPAILQEGMKFEVASQRARDAQLIEARKWQIGEIGRYWGIPLHMLGVDDQTNRSTVEEQSLNFVRFTVRPWIERVEQAIRRDLILVPRLYVAKFNLDELERGNMQARADFWAKMLGSGGSPQVLTVNEVRAEEGWNKSDDPQADRLAAGTNPALQPEAPAATAVPGPPGPRGERGSDGPQGKRGERGPEGSPGRQGEAGPAGSEGPIGPEGPQGKVGPVGPRGEAGPEGPPSQIGLSVKKDDLVASGEALVRKEVAALRRLAVRHADDEAIFRKAVAAFYAGFASEVAKKLGVTKDQAKAWCKKRSDRVTDADSDDVSDVIDAMEAEIDEAAATASQETV